ncbi:hypothetical protein VNO78_11093 [Psophocarpus tetragonolobus]|uniref:xyloglucan:xyloglucosyl transferase n=1 Tax=Psophocarpus tetragonolobus TaxID=3891 RepID=A0AAN9SSH0_PSOTE
MVALETEPRVEAFVNKSLYTSKRKQKNTQEQRERIMPINHTAESFLYNCNPFSGLSIASSCRHYSKPLSLSSSFSFFLLLLHRPALRHSLYISKTPLAEETNTIMQGSYTGFLLLFFCSMLFAFSSASPSNLPIIPFDEGYTPLFGDSNLVIHRDGNSVHLSLDERTGSGFVSHDLYLHGYFSASIKLPSDYTAGVVVAFYMSNGDMFQNNHDEIDFEFLGNIRGKDWRIQTNVYGNGSTNIGREERYGLWFDPADDFHQYGIVWTDSQIIFYVDNVPIREVTRTKSMGGDFPSKPMTLYATIWDASDWATNGGKYRVNYKYAPYVAEFSDLVLHGCAVDPIEHVAKCDNAPSSGAIPSSITPAQRVKMENFRKKHMTYSYCYDKVRYKVPPSECVINSQEAERLRKFDPVTFGSGRRHHGKRHRHNREVASSL